MLKSPYLCQKLCDMMKAHTVGLRFLDFLSGKSLVPFLHKEKISVALVSFLETALQQAGENRKELEKVLSYYKAEIRQIVLNIKQPVS